MEPLLVEVDDELADRLEAEEQATAEAFARHPDDTDAAFDPSVWEARGTPLGYVLDWAELKEL